jgi:hypothetical protein
MPSIGLLVFDEAHHCHGNGAYAQIMVGGGPFSPAGFGPGEQKPCSKPLPKHVCHHRLHNNNIIQPPQDDFYAAEPPERR